MDERIPKDYPQIGHQKYRYEWEAWRALALIIIEKDAESGKHSAGCVCGGFGCRLFEAVRAWGRTLTSDEDLVGPAPRVPLEVEEESS